MPWNFIAIAILLLLSSFPLASTTCAVSLISPCSLLNRNLLLFEGKVVAREATPEVRKDLSFRNLPIYRLQLEVLKPHFGAVPEGLIEVFTTYHLPVGKAMRFYLVDHGGRFGLLGDSACSMQILGGYDALWNYLSPQRVNQNNRASLYGGVSVGWFEDIPYAWILLSGPVDRVVQADAKARFAFSHLPPGRYRIFPSAPGFAVAPESISELELRPHSCQFIAPKLIGTHRISGFAKPGTRIRLSRVVNDSYSPRPEFAIASAAGEFSFQNLSPGPYHLLATPPAPIGGEFIPRPSEQKLITLPLPGGQTLEVEPLPRLPRLVTIKFLDVAGVPLVNSRFWAETLNGHHITELQSDSKAEASLELPEFVNYSIRWNFRYAYLPVTTKFELRDSGIQLEVIFPFRPEPKPR